MKAWRRAMIDFSAQPWERNAVVAQLTADEETLGPKLGWPLGNKPTLTNYSNPLNTKESTRNRAQPTWTDYSRFLRPSHFNHWLRVGSSYNADVRNPWLELSAEMRPGLFQLASRQRRFAA